jgi:uncharacterized protein (DUF2141 family)
MRRSSLPGTTQPEIFLLRSLVLALILAGAAQTAQAENTATLSIDIENLEPRGALMLQLFDSEAGYRGGAAMTARTIPVAQDTAQLEIESLAPGQYAFRLFHDLNGDGLMNTNPFGIPTEPFAFSNNARARFGPASWADAAFVLEPGVNAHRITLGGEF